MTDSETTTSICRFCHAACPLTVKLSAGRPVSVAGNRASPSYDGFCCTRGQAMVDLSDHPQRLLHSLHRQADGTFAPIASSDLIERAASDIERIVAEHGPESVAVYMGTTTGLYPLSGVFAGGWAAALGTPMIFSAFTIDQPGKQVAAALMGGWEAGPHGFDDADVWMIIGSNPVVTMGGTLPAPNSPRRLTRAIANGMKLIVIDPRKTETARAAHIHLQAIPGNDAAILAAMIHVILAEGLYDADFVASDVAGLEALRLTVQPFDPAVVAPLAGLATDNLVAAARMFASGRRGIATGATGANMSGNSTLTEYLIQCLNSICGRYVREGEAIANPGVLLPPALPRAQARAPFPATNPALSMSARGLTASAAGMPTAALADEILAGKIRALISVGGNPAVAFPDQERTLAALSALDLFLQVDVRMTPSAALAHYVMAPKVGFEVAGCSYGIESLEFYFGSWGMPEPFGSYAPKLIDPPAGADVMEEWEFFWALAKRMGLQLRMYDTRSFTAPRRAPRDPVDIDMTVKPTTDEMFDLLTRGSRIPLSEVRKCRDGAIFPADVRVSAKEAGCDARLQVGDPGMMIELGRLSQTVAAGSAPRPAGDLLLVSRRTKHLYNSSGQDVARLIRKGGTYNPAFLHPEEMARLGLHDGGEIEILSAHGAISAIVKADETLRLGVLSMTHAFGRLPSETTDFRRYGSNTGRLISVEDSFDHYSGIPRMSAIPVSIRSLAVPA